MTPRVVKVERENQYATTAIVRNSGKRDGNATSGRRLDDEVDELFKLPLAEFIGARNSLAARLKQSGRGSDANLVKALSKPSVSAWTVNQLYWKHRDAFDQLLAAGQRFHRAQISGRAAKIADIRESLDARREALSHLSDLATSLLREAGHNPTLDTIRRITTTLEAISALSSVSDGPTLGRLSQDIDPPGFESLASFVPTGGTIKASEPARVTTSQKSGSVATTSRQKSTSAREVRQAEETRQARIAAAKTSLQSARKALADARATAQSLEAAQKKASAEAKAAEKQLREAEERFKRARVVSEAAARRAQGIAGEAEAASKAMEDAKRKLENASKELESLFRESPAR